MPAAENTRSRHRAGSRRSRTESVTATRRSAHARHETAADAGRAPGTTESMHVTPNVIMSSGGSWNLAGVTRFARWLTDGATDRPHLRF